ncbi:MAG: hypothetical protein GX542_04445 [Rhodococcus sp.]|nr:hypothetical protein [Rhodococcus sp. (in: high G+C Gram-positive bacteria)]
MPLAGDPQPSATDNQPSSTSSVPGPAMISGITPVSDGYTDSGVPTYDSVREKIEGRYGTALGATELAQGSAAGQSAQDRWDEREKAAKAKLDAIRKAMGAEGPGAQ